MSDARLSPKQYSTLQAPSRQATAKPASLTGEPNTATSSQTQSKGSQPSARKPPKAKTCLVCKSKFQPTRTLQPTCSNFACSMEYAMQVVAKAKASKARKEATAHREAKVKAKTLTEWLDDAQDWVNRYIRLRDASDPCISCGTTNPNIQYAAGHYRTRKAASHLRFNHDNLHKQCNHRCNKQLSGNIAGYRPALIQKIGIERVEAIENDNSIHRWTIDEAKAVIAQHKLLIKELA